MVGGGGDTDKAWQWGTWPHQLSVAGEVRLGERAGTTAEELGCYPWNYCMYGNNVIGFACSLNTASQLVESSLREKCLKRHGCDSLALPGHHQTPPLCCSLMHTPPVGRPLYSFSHYCTTGEGMLCPLAGRQAEGRGTGLLPYESGLCTKRFTILPIW